MTHAQLRIGLSTGASQSWTYVARRPHPRTPRVLSSSRVMLMGSVGQSRSKAALFTNRRSSSSSVAEGPLVAQPTTPRADARPTITGTHRTKAIECEMTRVLRAGLVAGLIAGSVARDQDCLCQSVWNDPGRSTRS